MNYAVVVKNLSKQYDLYPADRPWRLHERLVKGFRRLQPRERFWALRDITFSVGAGRVVGVIGSNGSEKSTLLRLIAGVGRADSGHVKVNQRVSGLLDLGTGFHPDLIGRENIFVNAVIGGLTRREIAQRFDSIMAFSELEAFILYRKRSANPSCWSYRLGRMRAQTARQLILHFRPRMFALWRAES
jgi:lipopolysaccharide transport system ATP-binding protein